jgi:hypothetical protein
MADKGAVDLVGVQLSRTPLSRVQNEQISWTTSTTAFCIPLSCTLAYIGFRSKNMPFASVKKLQYRLWLQHGLREAVTQADALFIAIDTPSHQGDEFVNFSNVCEAMREIAGALSS